MLQAPLFDGLSLDPFSLQQNGLPAPEVDVGGGEVVEALVLAPVIVVLDEGRDLGFEIAGQEVALQEDALLLPVACCPCDRPSAASCFSC
jgi:hypothetical protein